jgi:outer membrane biosynthesis protein TonB
MTDRRPTLLILLIILSLVFHGCFLIVFLFMERPEQLTPSISFESFDDQDNNTQYPPAGVAALRPQASVFGAPVSFQQEPPPSLAQNDKPQPEDSSETAQDVESASQKTTNGAHDESKDQETTPSEKSAPASHETAQLSQESHQAEAQTSPNRSPQKKRRSKKRKSANIQTSAGGPTMPTRQINFADIAQGFIESLKHEGDDWLKRDGDTNRRPDEGEMRYLSYIQKVVWYLQNSFRQTEPKQWPTAAASVSFKITLNKEGEIHDLRCLQSCGNEKIDSFLRKRITQAGPFPPLPDHFKRNDFQILLSFAIGSQRMPQINGYIATIPPR